MSTPGDASRPSHDFHSESDFNYEFENSRLVNNECGNKKSNTVEHDAPDKGKKGLSSKKEDKEKKNALPPVGFISLFRYSDCWDKTLVIIGTIFAIVSGAAMPATTIGYGEIIDKMITYEASNENSTNVTMTTDEFLSEIAFWCSYNAAFGLYSLVFSYLTVSFFSLAAANQAFKIKCMFMASILKQDIGWYDTAETGDFASLISGDLTRIQSGIGEKVCICISCISSAILCACFGFYYSWRLSLVILSLTPVMIFAKAFMLKIQASVSREEMKEYGTAAAVAEEVLSSIRTVAAFGGEKKEIQRYDNCLLPAYQQGMKRGLLTALSSSITYLCFFLCYALSFWYGARLVIDGSLTGGTLVTVFMNINFASASIGQTTPYFEAFALAKGAAAKIYNIIDRVPSIDSSSKEGKKPHSIKGTIRIRNACFNYPARPAVSVLKGVSLHVQPGETVALVGPSGCGKSTILQLILRFYDANQGDVQLDENNVKDLNVGWLRDHIGLVGQEPVLFSTTIAENIRYGKPDATKEEIENAAKIANVHDFIRTLPLQYETLVGERGVQLSGGQKQRIAIARVLVKNPKVLLLDEATSALDTESESIVQAALDEASQGRTTVVVAHRLSTIRNADKIVVLCEGIVKEVGTHDELMKKEGTFFNLVQAQNKSPEKEKGGDELDEFDKREEHMIKELGWKLSALSGNSVGSDDGLQGSERRQTFSTITSGRRRSSAKSGHDRTLSQRSDDFELQMSVNSDKKEVLYEEIDDKLEAKASSTQLRLWKISASEWPYVLVGGIAAFLMGIHFCLFAIIFGDVLGALSGDPDQIREETNVFCLIYLIMAATAGVCNFLQVFMFSIVAEKLALKLRTVIFSNIIAQDLEYFDHPNNSVGSLCSRLTSEVSGVQGATGSRISIMLQATSTLISSIVLALWFEYKIGMVALACIPYVVFAVYFEGKVVRNQAARDKLGTEGASKVAIEVIEAIRTVASLHQEEIFLSEFKNHLLEPHRKSRTQSHVRGIIYGFVQALAPFSYAATLFYGSKLIAWKQLQFADVFKVIRAALTGAKEISQAVVLAPDFQKANASAERIFQLLEIKPKIDAFSIEGKKIEKINGHISFKKVNFAYPSRPSVQILRGFDLEIEPGKTVALVGSSGCGKSTCLQLLERFYEPHSGSVFLDNTDVGNMNVSNLRSHLGLVSQEPVLFSYSIAENIAYGDNSRQVDMHEIVEAARKANIHNFIITLPQGYETPVGDKGTQLSGGQKQRVAIARALLRNPKVLLLDEATSALDTESEKIVQNALDKARSGRTCLVIAHRLTTVQNADVIMVIHKGRIVEQGTHQELLNTKGHYYKLHNTQSSVK